MKIELLFFFFSGRNDSLLGLNNKICNIFMKKNCNICNNNMIFV